MKWIKIKIDKIEDIKYTLSVCLENVIEFDIENKSNLCVDNSCNETVFTFNYDAYKVLFKQLWLKDKHSSDLLKTLFDNLHDKYVDLASRDDELITRNIIEEEI